MSKSFNISDLFCLAQSLLDAKTKGREFMLEDVYNITRSAYEQYPEDPVINQVAFAIEKMATKATAGATISQADVSGIYNNFVRLSSNSKFKDVLGHLLLEEEKLQSTKASDYAKLNRIDACDNSTLKTDDLVDGKMVNAISSVFTGSMNEAKAFDQKVAENGKTRVIAELKSLGFKPSAEIMGGDKKNIVYAAHFDTRKGRVTVAIPTEVNNKDSVLFPSTFVADDHLEELTATKLQMFIENKSESENFSVPTATDILAAIKIVSGQIKTAEAKDIDALTESFVDQDKEMELSAPGLFVERNYDDAKPDIDTHQEVEMPKELAHLARDFEDSVLEAASSFGLATIQKGKQLIANELRSAGFKNAQVKFGSENADSVIYLASINTPKGPAEIEVPVEMKIVAENKYIPLSPTYFAFDGLIEDFTISKLQRFAVSMPAKSSCHISCSTAFNYMVLPELKDEILKAASENDYVTCEAALNEIQTRFNEEDFKNAIADYHFILMQKNRLDKQAECQCKCSKLLISPNSIEPRCGHLLVPISKVVTDESGHCRLRTSIERERLNPVKDSGAAISTSKINLT